MLNRGNFEFVIFDRTRKNYI